MDKPLITVERAAGYGIRRTRGRSVRACCHVWMRMPLGTGA